MIQLLKQREIERAGIVDRPMMYLSKDKHSYASNLPELFYNLDAIINEIPEHERYNLHYTLCECTDNTKPRIFARQNIIPFDIDKCDTTRLESYIEPVCHFLDVSPHDVGIVSSGNGIHFLIACQEYWDQDYFATTKDHYIYLAKGINNALSSRGLPGNVDTVLWAARRTLRLPSTKNIKEGIEKDCVVLNRFITPIPVSVKTLAGRKDSVLPEEVVPFETTHTGGTYVTDNQGVLNECDFLVHCKNNQEQVTEPQWRAMLSILTRLENGRELAHEYSQLHPNYSYEATEQKIEHSLVSSKPYLCKTIGDLGFDCTGCKWFGNCNSPITIKGDKFIGTKDTGFRNIMIMKDGSAKRGKVNYEDLLLYFEEQHDFRVSDSRSIYTWKGTHWEIMKDIHVNSFVEDTVDPAPNTAEVNEFVNKLYRCNIKPQEWFNNPEGKFNLSNGILDFLTQELIPHSKDYGFQYCADFAYDPDSEAPRWTSFIEEVTLGRKELKDVLMEYAGYILSGMECEYGKSLVLTGGGSNGKSKYAEVLQGMISSKAFTTFSMEAINKEYNIAEFQGRLVNISDETPKKSFLESSLFKTLTTGGTVQARRLYKDPLVFTNKSKLVLLANDLPGSDDTSFGFRRRLLIVPFDGQWIPGHEGTDGKLLHKLLKEKSGILNWIIKGYQQLVERGHFAEVGALVESLRTYIEDNDPLYDFCNEWLEVEPVKPHYDHYSKKVSFNDLYAHYVKYCTSNGIRNILASNMLGKRLKHQIPGYENRKKRVGGGRQSKITLIGGVSIGQVPF